MPDLSPEEWIGIALAAPAVGALVAWLAVPAWFDRLAGVLPGRPRGDTLAEVRRLALAYEASSGGAAHARRVGWPAVLGVRHDETSLPAVERAYRERVALLEAAAPRDDRALNGLHRAARDARAALR